MNGGKHERQISIRLVKSPDALDFDVVCDVTESLKKACRDVLQLEESAP
jgi:hypothetical protein